MKKWIAWLSFWILALVLSVNGQDKLEAAKNLLASGKTKEAIVMLKTVNPVDLKYADAMVVLAKAYLAAGKPDSAEYAVKITLNKNEKNAEAVIVLSQAYLDQKKKPETYAALRKGLKSMKNNPAILTQLGYIHMLHDSLDLAIVDFSRAKDSDPKFALAYEGLGDVYVKLQGESIAAMHYEEAVKLDSTKKELLYKLARVYMNERRYTEAAKIYNSILKLEPQSEAVRLELGNLYFAAKQYTNSAKILGPHVERHLDDEGTWKRFTEAVDNHKRYEIGYSTASQILKSNPKLPKALRLAGKSSYYTKKYQEAIGHYQTLAKIEPLNTEDFKYMGRSHLELKKDSLAVKYLEQSLALDSTQSDVFVDLGAAYMKLKKFNKASDMFQKKMNQDTTYVSAYINYALCNEAINRWDLAKNALIKALSLRPNYLPGHYNLAVCYARTDSVRAAKREYETVVILADTMKTRYKTELGDAYRYIAFAFLLDKNYSAALDAITNSLEYRPRDIELILWRAQTFHALNRKPEAKVEYQRVLKMDPKNKDATKGLEILELY